jgi:uncharacterized protein YbbK (DUF523 family)
VKRVIVSACLLGVESRYDGKSKTHADLIKKVREACVIPICPEQLGGLPTPREAASFQGGDGAAVLRGQARVVTVSGQDVTEQFIRGAKEALKLAQLFSVKKAYFKSKSPSCGCGKVYWGRKLVAGNGVCTTLFLENGIEVEEIE